MQERTRAFAWYNVLQDIGHALGGLLAALPSVLRLAGIGELASFQAAVLLYALLLLATAVLYLRLSAQAEAPLKQPRAACLTAQPQGAVAHFRCSSRSTAWPAAFVGTALLSYFFYQRFGVSESAIAVLFLGARGMNAVSHLGAAWLADASGW